MTKANERIAVFAFGVVFVITMLVLAVEFPKPTNWQFQVFRIILALAAAGVAAMIPGSIEVTASNWLKAGGALAVFVIVLYLSPAKLVADEPEPIELPISELVGKTVPERAIYSVRDGDTTFILDFREIKGKQEVLKVWVSIANAPAQPYTVTKANPALLPVGRHEYSLVVTNFIDLRDNQDQAVISMRRK